MKSVELLFFKVSFAYDSKLVEKLVKNAKKVGGSRSVALKHLVFKMMKEIVKKNILNYLNLLRGLHVPEYDIPETDDLITDCFIVYDVCVEKYELGHNFYFYFNKALSRYFYRLYNKKKDELENDISMEDEEYLLNQLTYSTSEGTGGSVEVLMDLLGFTELEKKVAHSKVIQQRTADFLNENPDITNAQYNRAMKRIKEVLIEYQKQEVYE